MHDFCYSTQQVHTHNMADEQIVKLLADHQTSMNRQTELLVQLTQIIASQNPLSSTSSSLSIGETSTSKAKLMESLSNSMTDFSYEPDSGLVFEAWYNRYKHIFEREASALDDVDKVALLWRKMSNLVHERFKTFVLPKQPPDISLKDTVKQLSELFGRTETQVSQRYRCLQLTKLGNEDFKEYASRVNLQCELFKLKELKDDHFKCLIFVLGLKSTRDSDIRIRLLRLLNEEIESTNLEKLVDETQKVMDLKSDTALIEEQPKHVNAIGKSSQASKLPKTPCWYCGELHYATDCPYSKHTCTSCQQTGHKDGYCNSTKKKHHKPVQENKKGQNRAKGKSKFHTKAVFSVNKSNFQDLRKYATVQSIKNRLNCR